MSGQGSRQCPYSLRIGFLEGSSTFNPMMRSPVVRILSPLKVETWKQDALTIFSLATASNKQLLTQNARFYVIIIVSREMSRDSDSKHDMDRLSAIGARV